MTPASVGPAEIVIPIDLGPRSYDIVVTHGPNGSLGPFVRATLDRTWAGKSTTASLLVTDQRVAGLPFASRVRNQLEAVGITTETAALPPGESTKCLDSASWLYDRLVAMKADRHTLVVALGGGVVGDLAGFVAATYARGLPLIMIPTTLLAQVDSSVGGKVGINHPLVKNIIGAFHQPAGVWIDTSTLDTLPLREIRCGLAEVVKYGLILDADFFESLESQAEAILDREPSATRSVIARSCQLKAQVVTADEREESGLRAVLNFGHTVGHAIEAVAGYGGAFQHGEAVAAGMVVECKLAEQLGWISPALTERVAGLLARFGLPTSIQGLDPNSLLEAMTRDKKNRDGRVRFVLPRALGHVELTSAVEPDLLKTVIELQCR